MSDIIYRECPHCNAIFLIESCKIPCGFGRCLQYKNKIGIIPCNSEKTAMELINDGDAWGCGQEIFFGVDEIYPLPLKEYTNLPITKAT